MELLSSISEPNVFITYGCMIADVNPTKGKLTAESSHQKLRDDMDDSDTENVYQDDHIKIERTKALHELIEDHADDDGVIVVQDTEDNNSTQYQPTTSSDDGESSENEEYNSVNIDNPKILKWTKMKWLSEGRDESPDSRSPSLSPTSSSTSSQCSRESQSKSDLIQKISFGNRYLSTILRLDKEHNLFGLSNIAIVRSKTSKRTCKKDEKAVFHQTTIVQICCPGKPCCRHKSNSAFPTSIKCRSCRKSGFEPCYQSCHNCGPCNVPSTCSHFCSSCSKTRCLSKYCLPPKCSHECTGCANLKLVVKRKPVYEHTYVELTPRSSCVLAKPAAARSCHHLPHCVPPSSCFPYLMPCYWPARASAPCSNPMRCFHVPPCPPPRKKYPPPLPDEVCPPLGCGAKNKNKCQVPTCPGLKKLVSFSDLTNSIPLETDVKKNKKKNKVHCECFVPQCKSCFVIRPKENASKSIALQRESSEFFQS